jgi:hypothetical protein
MKCILHLPGQSLRGAFFGLAAKHVLLAMVLSLVATGCGSRGQKSGRPDIDEQPNEELYGASTKAQLYEVRAKVRKRGNAAVKLELPDLIEGLESSEKLEVSQGYKDTCKQIVEKLKALQGADSKDAAAKIADEIGALADKLPGKADNNPTVE